MKYTTWLVILALAASGCRSTYAIKTEELSKLDGFRRDTEPAGEAAVELLDLAGKTRVFGKHSALSFVIAGKGESPRYQFLTIAVRDGEFEGETTDGIAVTYDLENVHRVLVHDIDPSNVLGSIVGVGGGIALTVGIILLMAFLVLLLFEGLLYFLAS